ncbi:MAG: DNA polymerase Y family protein [Pseudomonadales bacterium]
MFWLCVALPELPLEVFQPSEHPMVLLEQQRVLRCNPAAAARGIEPGLNVSTALALAGEVLLVERDMGKEQQRLNELAELAYRFSSQVVTYCNRRGDYCLLLEIGASLRLFNGMEKLLAQLGTALAESPLHPNGFTHRFGLAHTLKAAELVARSQPAQASDINVRAKEKHNALAHTPVALLDCEANAIAQCEDLGLMHLGDVLALPPATLGKRFNASFIRYLEQLQGKRADPQPWYKPARHFHRELFYLDGLRSHADLKQPMQQLLQEFCRYLQQRQLSCTSIRWSFTRFSKKKHSLRVHLSRAQANYHNLFELSELQLEQLPLDSPVECVALHCQQLIPVEQQHLDLFAKPDNSGDFCLLADKLTGRLGNEVLWRPGWHNHHLPEQANAPVAFEPQQLRELAKTRPAKDKKKLARNADRQQTLPYRPSWLLREPLPLEQRGERILLQGKTLSLLKGPERLQCNWWSAAASRDYFIAGLERGAGQKRAEPAQQTTAQQWAGFYWIYYDLQAKSWYLHGEFA